MGNYQEIQTRNRQDNPGYDPGIFSYVRWSDNQKLIVVTNFSWITTSSFELRIPADIIEKWGLKDGTYTLKDQLYNNSEIKMNVIDGEGKAKVVIKPSESFIYQL